MQLLSLHKSHSDQLSGSGQNIDLAKYQLTNDQECLGLQNLLSMTGA